MDPLSRGFEPDTPRERLMITLAALDVLLLFTAASYSAFLPTWLQQWVIPIDLAFVAIFAIEFLTRLARSQERVQFAMSHWYDLVSLLPAASLTLRSLRLVRIVRLWTVKNVDISQDGNWMLALLRAGLQRIQPMLVAILLKPMMSAGVRMVQPPLRRARMAAMAGSILDAQKEGIEQVALASLRIAKPLRPVAESVAGQKLVHAVTVSVLETVAQFLQTDEVNELLSDTVDSVLDESVEAMARMASPT
ncbi:MAG: hypothetical protein ACPHID_05020 [Thermoplasmatota archaeon]